MNGEWPDVRSRKLYDRGEGSPLDVWLAEADEIGYYLVAAALMALGDGTWLERYHWTRDLTTANQIVLVVSPQVIMTVRIPVEYPGYFVVISIDRP